MSQELTRARWGSTDPNRSPAIHQWDSLAIEVAHASILLVDDEPANLSLLRRALVRAGYSRIAETSNPLDVPRLFVEFQPDLICLDVKMTPIDGISVLKELGRLIPRDTYFPILMLNGEGSSQVKQEALSLGAKDFVTKPFQLQEVLLRINNLLIPRFLHLHLQDHNQVLETRVWERTRDLDQARLEVLDRLARAAEFRDDNTGEHVKRVGRIAGLLANAMGLGSVMVELVQRAAPLHDLGKIGIPDTVLLKPGRLTPEEFAVMQRHTTMGAEILAGGSSAVMRIAEEIALNHHERWDGSGYPTGLSGETIPIAARIVGLAGLDEGEHRNPFRSPPDGSVPGTSPRAIGVALPDPAPRQSHGSDPEGPARRARCSSRRGGVDGPRQS
jgi:putative two-component system response regulator